MIFNFIVFSDFKIFAYGQSGISLPISENLFTEELLVKMSFYNVIGFCMGYYFPVVWFSKEIFAYGQSTARKRKFLCVFFRKVKKIYQ